MSYVKRLLWNRWLWSVGYLVINKYNIEERFDWKKVFTINNDVYKDTIERNQFYDDIYSMMYEFEDGRKEEKKLVEFSSTELLEIRYMIDDLLKNTYWINSK